LGAQGPGLRRAPRGEERPARGLRRRAALLGGRLAAHARDGLGRARAARKARRARRGAYPRDVPGFHPEGDVGRRSKRATGARRGPEPQAAEARARKTLRTLVLVVALLPLAAVFALLAVYPHVERPGDGAHVRVSLVGAEGP